MVASFFALLIASAPALVSAIVTPSSPGPGDVFKAGSDCKLTWKADSQSTSQWKDMAIELMTGDNFHMVHITTVTTGQDGTADGQFTFTCPEVTPNSAIYFYQFSSPSTSDLTWTTRFTIAGADGSTSEPSNSTQPDGSAIPWGTGALVDPSKGSAAPDFAAAAASTASVSITVASIPSSSSPSSPSDAPVYPTTVSSSRAVMTTSRTGSSPTTGAADNAGTAVGQSAAVTSPSPTGSGNGALGSVRINGALTTLVGSALAFTFLF
ncbi:hypothetical protein VKT23_017044 [Stygiomarasmius scandens]|uniref:Yeast cell wall synthesis Kre9/Knh1-like N-terminal domain-containing protein n=1 Tax=Marasmiellus scandens TaxID=2682957 RepID=A0ABR1IX80_9AGAR